MKPTRILKNAPDLADTIRGKVRTGGVAAVRQRSHAMSVLAQNEIEALLASANESAGETVSQPASAGARPRAPRKPVQIDPAELRRILHIRFPIIVTLAERQLPFQDLLKLSPGSIIEIDRASDAEPDLAIGNRKIGRGQAVKVGEYFGLRITTVEPVRDRIRAMGR